MSGDGARWWPLVVVREVEEADGEGSMVLGACSVVLRCRLVVSALGGGGRDMAAERGAVKEGFVGSREARQRKHSPVP